MKKQSSIDSLELILCVGMKINGIIRDKMKNIDVIN